MGKYSPSGSQIIISSFVTIKTLVISRFAAKDLPAPGVPTIKPFGFFIILLYNSGIDFTVGGVYNKLVSVSDRYNTEV